ncbi:12420_t:CDS:2, partial [Gigaspora rosea]
NTTHNKQKTVVRGYLLVKDKNRDFRNCKEKAVTNLEGQIHILKKFSEHNHASEPSCVDVIQALNNIKELASQTREKLSQIIHDVTIEMTEDSFYYMLNSQALCKQISRIRLRNLASQPQTLQEIDIPIQLQTTMRGERFLAREIDINNEKIMIFCTIGGEKLLNLSEEAGYNLSPPVIITDFEQSVINAVQSKFSNSTHKAIEYGSNEAFSLRLCHLVALAFLPPLEIPVAFDMIKPMMPSNTTEIINYFENNYIYGRIRQWLRNGVTTRKMHLGTYTIIEEMRKEQQQVDMQIERVLRGEPRPTQQKHLIDYKRRILSVFNNRDTYTLVDFLRDIAHNISL